MLIEHFNNKPINRRGECLAEGTVLLCVLLYASIDFEHPTVFAHLTLERHTCDSEPRDKVFDLPKKNKNAKKKENNHTTQHIKVLSISMHTLHCS